MKTEMRLINRQGWCEADTQIKTPLKADRGASCYEENIKNPDGAKVKKGTIPIFFATDDNYLPFLAVTLQSIYDNSSRDYAYKAYVLHSGVSDRYYEKIMAYSKPDFEVEFVDVTAPLAAIAKDLHMRDYYTCTTYFRVFIAGMFPQYDKALYLDCDTVVLGDISALFNYDMGDNLIAGAPCEGVNSFEVYKTYVRELGGVSPDTFFNAGVLLMNLKAFREEGFYTQFADLLKKYKFRLIQDEDYLNVICQDRILQLPRAWNKFPVATDRLDREDLRIVHYGLTWKPWKYGDIPYGEYFWEYAKKTVFYEDLLRLQASYTQEGADRDRAVELSMQALAREEASRADGYFKTYGKCYGKKA